MSTPKIIKSLKRSSQDATEKIMKHNLFDIIYLKFNGIASKNTGKLIELVDFPDR